MKPFNFTAESIKKEILEFTNQVEPEIKSNMGNIVINEGVSEREKVYQQDKVSLYHYRSLTKTINKTPLLIIYALVNRPYMLDLQNERSIIRRLLEEGQDIYLIDWGYADEKDKYTSLDDYINRYIDESVEVIKSKHKVKKVNLLGVCQGGSFSLCYSALYPQKVKTLITMVTPVDFKTDDNRLSAWVQHIDIDAMVDTMGNISGEYLSALFLSLKPFALQKKKYLDAIKIINDKEKLTTFLAMEKWIFDSPDQAGEAFRQFIKDFFQQNKFLKGGLMIGNREVDLKNIKCPILNVYAEQDNLVPPRASQALKGLTNSSDYSELAFSGGHIGIYVSAKSQQHVAPAMAKWIKRYNKIK